VAVDFAAVVPRGMVGMMAVSPRFHRDERWLPGCGASECNRGKQKQEYGKEPLHRPSIYDPDSSVYSYFPEKTPVTMWSTEGAEL